MTDRCRAALAQGERRLAEAKPFARFAPALLPIVLPVLLLGAGCTSAPEARRYRCVRSNLELASGSAPVPPRPGSSSTQERVLDLDHGAREGGGTIPVDFSASGEGGSEVRADTDRSSNFGDLVRCLLDPSSPLVFPLGLFAMEGGSAPDF